MIFRRVVRAASATVLLAGCGGDSKNPAGPDSQCNRGSLTLGTVRTGTVASSDCVFPVASDATGGQYDAYSVTLTAGQVYQVLHQATVPFEWDPFLEVLEPGGDVIAFSDDDAATYNSELFFIAPTTGTYAIRAGGLDELELGNYRLAIRACAATQITSTTAISGALTSGDCRTTFAPSADSSLADVYLFTNTGTTRNLTVTTSNFTPAFIASGPGFAFESDLFLLSTLGSPATMTVPAALTPGTYLVIVSAEGAITGGGSYTIQSSVASGSARIAPRPSALAAWRPSAKGR